MDIIEQQLGLALTRNGYTQAAADLRLRSRWIPEELACWLIPGPDALAVLSDIRHLPGFGYLKTGFRVATDAVTSSNDGRL